MATTLAGEALEAEDCGGGRGRRREVVREEERESPGWKKNT